MAQQIFPEWRRQNEPTKYPFADRASLTNATGRLFIEGTFFDAALYPVGAGPGLHLSRVEIDHQQVRLVMADGLRREAASGTLPLVGAPDNVILEDGYGRPAGVLVSEGRRLGIFQSWGTGVHTFEPAETEFCATVCFPTPEAGVRGIALPDGTLLTGDVWLVGDDGVVLRPETVVLPGACGRPAQAVRVVRVDVVGDPLFRRRLCIPTNLFTTPRPVQSVRVVAPNTEFVCLPDEAGEMKLTGSNAEATDTVLRVVTTPAGIRIGAVGSAPRDA